jgi:hypothetical protein
MIRTNGTGQVYRIVVRRELSDRYAPKALRSLPSRRSRSCLRSICVNSSQPICPIIAYSPECGNLDSPKSAKAPPQTCIFLAMTGRARRATLYPDAVPLPRMRVLPLVGGALPRGVPLRSLL